VHLIRITEPRELARKCDCGWQEIEVSVMIVLRMSFLPLFLRHIFAICAKLEDRPTNQTQDGHAFRGGLWYDTKQSTLNPHQCPLTLEVASSNKTGLIRSGLGERVFNTHSHHQT